MITEIFNAKYFTLPFKTLLKKNPDLSSFLISENPPKFDLGNPKVLSLLNKYLFKDVLQLDLNVPEDHLIPALGIRHVYCDIINSLTQSQDPLIEIGTGANAVLAMILAKKYNRKVIATEINEISVNYAKKNVEANSLSEFITILQSRGEIVEDLLPTGNYSTLLCYPPIYDNDQTKLWKKRGWKGVESEIIGGGKDGLDFTRHLIEEAIDNKNKVRIHNITTMLMNRKQTEKIISELPKQKTYQVFQINAGTRKRFVLWIQNY